MFVDEKQQGEAKPVQVGMLKLSQAIRIGARMGKQIRCKPYIVGTNSCALGSAMLALGMNDATYKGHYGTTGLEKLHPQAFEALNAFSRKVGFPIQHANDYQGWTREQVADWLESQGY